MKKGIALALATMMVTSLAACGNTQDAVTSESTQPAGKNGYRGAYRHHVDFHRLV